MGICEAPRNSRFALSEVEGNDLEILLLVRSSSWNNDIQGVTPTPLSSFTSRPLHPNDPQNKKVKVERLYKFSW